MVLTAYSATCREVYNYRDVVARNLYRNTGRVWVVLSLRKSIYVQPIQLVYTGMRIKYYNHYKWAYSRPNFQITLFKIARNKNNYDATEYWYKSAFVVFFSLFLFFFILSLSFSPLFTFDVGKSGEGDDYIGHPHRSKSTIRIDHLCEHDLTHEVIVNVDTND